MRNAILATLLVACAATPQTTQELLTSRHSVMIEVPYGLGSGFPITDMAYLTARHVVQGADPEHIRVNGMPVAEVIFVSDLDVAILIMKAPHGLKPWSVRDYDAAPGEVVYKSGYGQGFHWWTEGLGTEDSGRIALDVYPGDSGGPIFDQSGKVVALVVAVGAARGSVISHHCWVVPMSKILPELPEGFFDPIPKPALPAQQAPETPWESFQRLKKERGL